MTGRVTKLRVSSGCSIDYACFDCFVSFFFVLSSLEIFLCEIVDFTANLKKQSLLFFTLLPLTCNRI